MDATVTAQLRLDPGLLCYLGPLPDLAAHRHPALALCLALERPLALPGLGRVRSVLVGADAAAPAMGFGGQRAAVLFVDAAHPAYPVLRLAAAIGPVSEENGWLAAAECGPHALAQRLARLGQGAVPDPRVARVLACLEQAGAQDSGLAALAQVAGLSPPRLQHLFKEVTGTTPRRYRLWQRLRTAVVQLAQGQGLTGAAHAAGFADSSHLSRTAREFFGLAPRQIVHGRPGLRIHLAHATAPLP